MYFKPMKRTSLSLLLLLICMIAAATPITQKKAQVKAADFAQNRFAPKGVVARLAHTVKDGEGDKAFYVFNIGQKQGFVMVAVDDAADDIIGYSDRGEFDYEKMPDNMRAWLSMLGEEMTVTKNTQSNRSPQGSFHPTTVVEPLITSIWGQWEPFNKYCPELAGELCPTGCTATAMAQVMRYYGYPTEACQPIPGYTTTANKIKMPALEATVFDWELMPDELTEDTPEESINEVAKLMLYCGQATDMNYDSSGSGAYTYKIPERLPKYFGYASTMHYLYRESYDEAAWDSLLVRELVNQRPVIYTAYTNLGQGHTFICDGYDGNGLYHINWGWVGVGNGYFRISVLHAKDENLNPHIKNYHLSMNQTALVGLQPSGKDTYVAPKEYFRAYSRPSLKEGRSYSRTAANKPFPSITLKQSMINTTEARRNLYHGLGLYNVQGELVTVLWQSLTALKAGEMTTFEATGMTIKADVSNGHYTIRPIYKQNSSSAWRWMGGADKNYVEVDIEDTEMTLIPVPKADFVTNKVDMDGDYLRINFDNNDEEFYGPIYVRKLNTETDLQELVATDNLSFDPNTNSTMEIYIDEGHSLDLHSDIFFLSVDEYDSQYFYSNMSSVVNNLKDSVAFLNLSSDNTTIVGDRIMCDVTLTNQSETEFMNTVTISLAAEEGNITTLLTTALHLLPGESTHFYFEPVISNFDTRYLIKITYKGEEENWISSSTDWMPVAEGAIYWTKDGTVKTQEWASTFEVPEEALAINLRKAYGTRVVPNSNPNTIYMLDKTMANGLSGKNFVNYANKGTTLKLTEGYDFFFPVKFTFTTKATYQRTLDEASQRSWSTLYLPFSPDQITCDDEEVTWHHDPDAQEGDETEGDSDETASEDEGAFWLMEFEGVDSIFLTTSYAHELTAYQPYLIANDSTLSGKTLTFTATKCTLDPTPTTNTAVTKGDYTLQGTNALETLPQSFVMAGDTLRYVEESTDVAAFRACLTGPQLDYLIVDIDKVEEVIPDPQPLMGDADGNGEVNVVDVMLIVSYVVGDPADQLVEINADMNADGEINVIDAMAIVELILSY